MSGEDDESDDDDDEHGAHSKTPEEKGIEANVAELKSLQDWSKWLVGVDAGVLALLEFSIEKGHAMHSPEIRTCLSVAVVFFAFSLFVATWLVGASPIFIYYLKSGQVGDWFIGCPPDKSIYQFPYGTFTLQQYAFVQHIAFLGGAVFLVIALLVQLSPWS